MFLGKRKPIAVNSNNGNKKQIQRAKEMIDLLVKN